MFNLSKHSQSTAPALEDVHQTGELGNIEQKLLNESNEALNIYKGQGNAEEFDSKKIQDKGVADAGEQLYDFRTLQMAHDYLKDQGAEGKVVWQQLVQNIAAYDVANSSTYFRVADEIEMIPELTAVDVQVRRDVATNVLNGPLGTEINRLLVMNRQEPTPTESLAFNLKRHKTAQWPVPQQNTFPVKDAGDLAAKFMDRLVTNNPETYAEAVREILEQVQGDIQEEEINSMLQKMWDLDYERDQAQAAAIFGQMFDMLPAHLKMQNETQNSETAVMSKTNPKGIIKFDLPDHVLDNKESSTEGMIKTAADQFGQQYMLYGPTEKRVCPKLRGKGGGPPGSGDVVSEYICRHHCLDGLVIDDNKTICGEAVWRADVMDKYSREYVDADGNIVGGYLNKRFEINRNVPEENKMRLKPGETRKPRPAEIYGNMEARMQAMREKEGEKRGYRPKTDTSAPFNWTRDVDQNNVEASQAERDRREESAGHQTVEYSEKPPTENKPKVASQQKIAIKVEKFNLRQHKTAQGGSIAPVVEDGKAIEPVEVEEGEKRKDEHPSRKEMKSSAVENDDIKKVEVKEFPKEGFNLKQHKMPKEAKKKYNPWAVCNKSTGGKNEAGKEKFERCVQHVKDQSRGKEMECPDESKKKS